MNPTTPSLGLTGMLGMILVVAVLVGMIVWYHVWMSRRTSAERGRDVDRPEADGHD